MLLSCMEQEHRTEGRARGRHLGTPGLTLLTLGGVMGSGLFLASAQAPRCSLRMSSARSP